MTNPKFSDVEYAQLHAKGLPDYRVAKMLNVNTRAVWARRVKLGLPVNPRPSRRFFTDNQLLDLHKQGLTDLEIASKLSVTYETVQRYRSLLGFSPNKKIKWNYEPAVSLYNEGFSVRQVAQRAQIPEPTLMTFLKKRKLLRSRKDAIGRRMAFRDNISIPHEKWKHAYLAGLIDGEGSIFVRPNVTLNKPIPSVKVSNTDKKMIDWILRNFGGYPHSMIRNKHGWKPIFRWETGSVSGCFKILTATLPYLITKRENAFKVLDFCANKLKLDMVKK